MDTTTGGPDGAGTSAPRRPLTLGGTTGSTTARGTTARGSTAGGTTARGTTARGHRRRALAPAVAVLAVLPLAACTPTSSSSKTSTSSRTVVVIRASDDTCWQATVDGRKRKGCGNAEFTDRRGDGAAKVVKTKGDSRIRVRLVVGGRTVDRVSVRDADTWVSVESSDG